MAERHEKDPPGGGSTPSLNELLADLTREIRQLRDEVRGLRDKPLSNQRTDDVVWLRAQFSMTGELRKPYSICFVDEAAIRLPHKLTDVRTAILLVLLMDLRYRSTGGSGFSSPFEKIREVLELLTSSNPSPASTRDPNLAATSPKALQVALDRFAQFVTQEGLFDGLGVQLILNRTACRLDCPNGGPALHVDIRTHADLVSRCLDQVLLVSPLQRVRQQGVVFVPGGPDEFDKLFLDFFAHSFPVHERSLYFKPSIITYPDRILDRLNASVEDRRRKQIVCDGFRTGRVSFTEIIRKETLREMTSMDDTGKSKLYGPQISRDLIVEHLAHLSWMVRTYAPRYRLVLTDAPLPFFLCTFEIGANVEEKYTVFFRNLIREHDPSVECIALLNHEVTNNINKYVFEWVLQSPQSTSDPDEVVRELDLATRWLRA